LFFEGPGRLRSTINFSVLLGLATVIATYGVLSDSTATVVGAMIIAPMMTPIMAAAAALVMGRFDRVASALALVGAGVVGVVALAIVLSSWVPSVVVSFAANGEITSRVSPGPFALLVALAAGAAGSFALARQEISDAMPGVAIAISLEPPLSVVGIALAKGNMPDAEGAALLFVTNFFAILLAGGTVFWIMGLGIASCPHERIRARLAAFMVVLISILVISVPLLLTGRSIVRSDLDQWRASQGVSEWLADTEADVLSVNVADNAVVVSIASAHAQQLDQRLIDVLSSHLGRPVQVTLRVIPQQRP
jgi:uncharacterized hydrophobic protein (TIGR00271 family)